MIQRIVEAFSLKTITKYVPHRVKRPFISLSKYAVGHSKFKVVIHENHSKYVIKTFYADISILLD